MPFLIERNDITTMKVDAIVNAANNSLLGGGGVDGAIHRAAGPELLRECETLGGCKTGEAKLTGGYLLPAKHVIHTVGPIWRGGDFGEEALLRSCYRNSLEIAESHGFETVAFPLISSGVYGYPKDKALRVASDEITAFLTEHGSDMTVTLVLYYGDRLFSEEGEDSRLRAQIERLRRQRSRNERWRSELFRRDERLEDTLPKECCAVEEEPEEPEEPSLCEKKQARKTSSFQGAAASIQYAKPAASLQPNAEIGEAYDKWLEPAVVTNEAYDDELIRRLAEKDESFAEMLLRKIDESGMTDAQCYKRANIDRKLFSKIRGDMKYRPSKTTATAFAFALELPFDEAKSLIEKAGYSLTESNAFDIIIMYYLKRDVYDIYKVNECLFKYDQPLLGSV